MFPRFSEQLVLKLFLDGSLRPADKYVIKVNNRNVRTRCEICSMLTINTPDRRYAQINAGLARSIYDFFKHRRRMFFQNSERRLFRENLHRRCLKRS